MSDKRGDMWTVVLRSVRAVGNLGQPMRELLLGALLLAICILSFGGIETVHAHDRVVAFPRAVSQLAQVGPAEPESDRSSAKLHLVPALLAVESAKPVRLVTGTSYASLVSRAAGGRSPDAPRVRGPPALV